MNNADCSIRQAHPDDADRLTEISFAAKRHWNHPESYLQLWQEELTVTRDYLREHLVYLIACDTIIVGYYSLVGLRESLIVAEIALEPGWWLDHMFIEPEWIGNGLGKRLFNHLSSICRVNDITAVQMLADPHAMGFYEKMGCRYIKEVPSTIAGRTTPLMIKEMN